MKNEGYHDSQIAEQIGKSIKTVRRMRCINPEHLCVDGTKTRKRHKLLEPYRKPIQELVEHGFRTSQILKKLKEMFPGLNVKRTTLSDFCINLRSELFEDIQLPTVSTIASNRGTILNPYVDKIIAMLAKEELLTVIFAAIKADGYPGSYSLLQQYCFKMKPPIYKAPKAVRKIKRRDLVKAVWSDKTDWGDKNISYIGDHYPVLIEIKGIISEFRAAYSQKEIESVQVWCDKYSQCKFPRICSFIKGINADSDAFYNSMKYTYSNGLLEGCVNKLKAVKRSMFGRASYNLLRVKLLLANQA
jgi:hypothetical protein